MIKEEIINFKYFNFNIENYSLFRRFEVVVGNKIRQQTCCSYVLSSVHCFLARVQSLTCTTYGKFLLISIIAKLTAKSDICTMRSFSVSIFTYIIRSYCLVAIKGHKELSKPPTKSYL